MDRQQLFQSTGPVSNPLTSLVVLLLGLVLGLTCSYNVTTSYVTFASLKQPHILAYAEDFHHTELVEKRPRS